MHMATTTLILLKIDPDETGLVVRVEFSRPSPSTVVNTTGSAAPEQTGPGLAKCGGQVIELRRRAGGSK